MLYGFRDNDVLIVAAADDQVIFDNFKVTALQNIPTASEVDDIAFIIEDRFDGFADAVLFSGDTVQLETDFRIAVLNRVKVLDKFKEMRAKNETHEEDSRSIAEVYGLDVNDPWNMLTDEQKLEQEEMRKQVEEQRKKGEATDESFGSKSKDKKSARIIDIRTHRNSDGSVSVDDVLAEKGVYEDTIGGDEAHESNAAAQAAKNAISASVEAENEEEETPTVYSVKGLSGQWHDTSMALIKALGYDPEEYTVDLDTISTDKLDLVDSLNTCLKLRKCDQPFEVYADQEKLDLDINVAPSIERGPFNLYYRVDIIGPTIFEVMEAMETGGQNPKKFFLMCGELEDGFWGVCGIERLANKVATIVTSAIPTATSSVYSVNRKGERILEEGIEGVSVLDENEEREIGPRPWNAREAEWHAFTDEERAAEMKLIQTDEFIFTGSYDRPHRITTIMFTPETYFREHGCDWDGDLHSIIKDALPDDLVLTANGTYRSMSREYNHVMFTLVQNGYKESDLYRIWLNQQAMQ